MAYIFVYDREHPLATSWKTVLEHRKVLYDAIGPGTHPCHWCQTPVTWRRSHTTVGTLVVDHLDSDPTNNDLSNLVPSCHSCNCKRARHNVVADNEQFITHPSRRGRLRALEVTCPNCNTAFLAPAVEVRKGRRKFCSRPCMYQGRGKH